MEEIMPKLTKATEDLKRASTIQNYWTLLVIIILAGLSSLAWFPSIAFLEPFLLPVSLVYLIIVSLLFIINFLVKDNQRKIMIGLIRGLVGFLLPLLFIVFTRILIGIGAILTLIGLIVFYLIFNPVYELMKAQKEIQKIIKEQERK